MKIVLIGFMGSGKTSVAEGLAKTLDLKSIDMDEQILKQSGYESINEIFEKKREKAFRKMELTIAEKLADVDGVVISTGGGVITKKQAMTPLLKNAIVIYLKLKFVNASSRISQKEIIPPLFQDIVKAKELFSTRGPLYTQYADIIVDTDNKEISEVLDHIIVELRKGKNGR